MKVCIVDESKLKKGLVVEEKVKCVAEKCRAFTNGKFHTNSSVRQVTSGLYMCIWFFFFLLSLVKEQIYTQEVEVWLG